MSLFLKCEHFYYVFCFLLLERLILVLVTDELGLRLIAVNYVILKSGLSVRQNNQTELKTTPECLVSVIKKKITSR